MLPRFSHEYTGMRDVWDVAVVGAGPAGAAAARAAAASGARRCGGGLIGPAQRVLADAGVDVAALARDHAGRFSFQHGGRHAFTRSAPPFLPMVLRSELDAELVRVAQEAGGELRTRLTGGA